MKNRHIIEVLKDGLFFVDGKCLEVRNYINDKTFQADVFINQSPRGVILVKADVSSLTYKVSTPYMKVGYSHEPRSLTNRDLKLLVKAISQHTDWKYVE